MDLPPLAQPSLPPLAPITPQPMLILILIPLITALSIPLSRSRMPTLGLIHLNTSPPKAPSPTIPKSSIPRIRMPRPLRAQNLPPPCLARSWSKSSPVSKHVSTSSKLFTIGSNSRECVATRTSSTTTPVSLSHFPRSTMATSTTTSPRYRACRPPFIPLPVPPTALPPTPSPRSSWGV